MAQIAIFALFGVTLMLAAAAFELRRREAVLVREKRAQAQRENWYRDQVIALLIAARRSPLTVIEHIEAAAHRIAPAIEAVFFAEPEDDALVVRYAKGLHSGFVSEMRLDPTGRSALAQAIAQGHRVATGARGVDTLCGEGAYLAVPLISRGHVLGAIAYLAATASDLGDLDDQVHLIELATPAYELAKERRADITAAERDGLTGLLSPVVFRRKLAEEIHIAKRAQSSYSLIFVDTDHFKACNDTLGHGAGDIVLTAIAQIMVSCGGTDGIVGRNGGDEFCLAVPLAKSAALRTAEQLRAAIAGHPYHMAIGAALPKPITASIGVATFPDDCSDARSLLEAADAAMYVSKRNGRNRVSFVGMPEPSTAGMPMRL